MRNIEGGPAQVGVENRAKVLKEQAAIISTKIMEAVLGNEVTSDKVEEPHMNNPLDQAIIDMDTTAKIMDETLAFLQSQVFSKLR